HICSAVFARHMAKQSVTVDAGITYQHCPRALFGPNLFACINCRVPVGNIAHGSMKFLPQGGLLRAPLLIIAAGAATRNNGVSLSGQSLAYCGSDAAHAACYVSHFTAHVLLLVAKV